MRQYAAIRAMVEPAIEAIEQGDLARVAGLVLESWQFKKSAVPSACNTVVDDVIAAARDVDSVAGGKLLGSGGGGYVLVVTSKPQQVLERLGRAARQVWINSSPASTMIL